MACTLCSRRSLRSPAAAGKSLSSCNTTSPWWAAVAQVRCGPQERMGGGGVHPTAAERGLDVVIADPAGRVERAVDVLLGQLDDQRFAVGGRSGGGMVSPDAGVAVGLQFEPYRAG